MGDEGGARYRVIGLLGRGGSATVERVLDARLGRILARKRSGSRLADAPQQAERFASEARLQARLQHPCVVPVHELEPDEDGHLCFTLSEVQGRTLREEIGRLHAVSSNRGWGQTPDGLSLRRLVDALARVAETVAFAHAEGVVHRDLKPANVMMGPTGELLVLDWGIARVLGEAGPAGRIEGTPAYMAPEATRGGGLAAPALDVFGLGAILYEILSGRPPVSAQDPRQALAEAAACAPPPPGRVGGPEAPTELSALCQRCLAPRPEDRPDSALAVAQVCRAWLDGVARQEAALEAVEAAAARLRGGDEALRAAEEAQGRAREALRGVMPWEPEDRKLEGWALEDEARRHLEAATRARAEAEALLETAVALAPEQHEARAALAELHGAALVQAEAAGDLRAARDALGRLRGDVEALPPAHPGRASGAALLTGDGWLTLHTDPPGATVILERYEARGRRSVPVPLGEIGRTPLVERRLPAGSYRLRLLHEGRHEVLYPVLIGRMERWTNAPDPEGASVPVPLPPLGALAEDHVYVAAGPFISVGDPEDGRLAVARRAWLPGYVITRDPITAATLLGALNAMVAEGQEQLARAVVPRRPSHTPGADLDPLFDRDAAGRYQLGPGAPDRALDLPITMLDHRGATALARWMSSRGRAWRLPSASQWEKAGRGADGRKYPMGDTLLPRWTWCRGSAPAVSGPAPVDQLVLDLSPYGLRGASGNVRTWSASPGEPAGDRVRVLGADWLSGPERSPFGAGIAEHPFARFPIVGLRMTYEVPESFANFASPEKTS